MAAAPTPFAWLVPHLVGTALSPCTTACFQLLSTSRGPFELWPSGGIAKLTNVVADTATDFGGTTLYSTSIVLPGLQPDTSYTVELRPGGSTWVFDRTRVRTWPYDLSEKGRAFRVFLGSCFSVNTSTPSGNDLSGLAKKLEREDELPHLKFLCGDQVYLDTPAVENLPGDAPGMQRFVLAKYLANWGAIGTQTSKFGSLLRAGSCAFMSDDHEFWNNYPNSAIYAPSLYKILDGKQRSLDFETAAQKALSLFQRVPPGLRIAKLKHGAGELTLAKLDGRYRRGAELAHAPDDLAALTKELASCTGPALVVLSQPLFDSNHGGGIKRWIATHIKDLTLSDFRDYADLVRALAGCRHDVCVLSGDIHGGRVMRVHGQGADGQTLYEVVSSPLSLVGPFRSWGGEKPSNGYPDFDGPRPKYGGFELLTPRPVEKNHGVALSITSADKDVQIHIRYLQADSGNEIDALSPGSSTITLRSRP